MKKMSELILVLNISKNRKYFLITENLQATEQTEEKLGLKFPDAISEFYSIYNGGFIPNTLISEKKINDGRFYDEIEWESNVFLSLEDIMYYYNLEEENAINFKHEEYLNSKRLIPFFRTKQQELLVFTENSLLLWAKELDNNQILWIPLFQNFESFLNEYIENEGEINL